MREHPPLFGRIGGMLEYEPNGSTCQGLVPLVVGVCRCKNFEEFLGGQDASEYLHDCEA